MPRFHDWRMFSDIVLFLKNMFLIANSLDIGEERTIMSRGYLGRHNLQETWLFLGEIGFLINFSFLQLERSAGSVTISNGPEKNTNACRVELHDSSKINETYLFHYNALSVTFMSNGISTSQPNVFRAVIAGANTAAAGNNCKLSYIIWLHFFTYFSFWLLSKL